MRRPTAQLVLAAIATGALVPFAMIGCGGGGGGGGAGGGGSFGLSQRVPVTTLTFPGTSPATGAVDLADAFGTTTFSNPLFITAAPGDSTHLYVVEQRGRIRVVNTTGTPSPTTFLDVTSRVTNAGGEEGLLGLAFHPGYATNGRFFVNYIAAGSTPRNTIIAEYHRSAANALQADAVNESVILTVNQPYTNHNAGMISFGQDGFLYVSFGDGGSGGDPENRALDRTTLLGKMIRIDVDSASPYAVPSSNPFVAATDGTRPEIWALGLRNPFRWSFDRTTGDLWLGDVGQGAREEVDIVTRGGNYGWRAMEGNLIFSSADTNRGPFIGPVLDYGRGTGQTVIGGYVYRGSAIPALYGAYVYGDHGSGTIWALRYDGQSVTRNDVIGSASEPASFGEDTAGEMYVCEHGSGRIKKLVPHAGGGGGSFPQTLSATGIFADLATLEPNPGLIPYDVNAPLWSDGALKDRLLALPGVSTIGWSEDGAWTFPVGTTLVKTFRLPLTTGDPSSAVKVETRVLLNTSTGWEGYSYRWRDDQSDADLLPDTSTRTFTIADASAPGGTRSQTWTFPSRGSCLACHTAAAGRILGLTTRQLNRDFAYPARTDNQLRAWDHVDLFDVNLPAHDLLPAHPSTSDAGAPVAARARAYLDANCSMCHRPGGPAAAGVDLRSTIAVSSMGTVGVAPQHGNMGLSSPQIVQSGVPSNSVLWLRMGVLDSNRMPPLASSVVDADGVELLRQWIQAGP
jgi:uncharacterized repeat protein (TIGR03806 family)